MKRDGVNCADSASFIMQLVTESVHSFVTILALTASLTEIYSKYAKSSIQVAVPKKHSTQYFNIICNTCLVWLFENMLLMKNKLNVWFDFFKTSFWWKSCFLMIHHAGLCPAGARGGKHFTKSREILVTTVNRSLIKKNSSMVEKNSACLWLVWDD